MASKRDQWRKETEGLTERKQRVDCCSCLHHAFSKASLVRVFVEGDGDCIKVCVDACD